LQRLHNLLSEQAKRPQKNEQGIGVVAAGAAKIAQSN